MAVKVWNGSQYVDAAFAGAKHAYIWNGSGYDEVWADSPYPVVVDWGPQALSPSVNLVATWVVPESGLYSTQHTVNGGSSTGYIQSIVRRGNITQTAGMVGPGPIVVNLTTLHYAGEVVEFLASESTSDTMSGTAVVERGPEWVPFSETDQQGGSVQLPQSWYTIKSWTAPRDMVVTLTWGVTWTNAYPSQSCAIRVDGLWVAGTMPGTKTMSCSRRVFVRKGSTVIFEVNNNTAASYRYLTDSLAQIDEVPAIDDPPAYSGGINVLGETPSQNSTFSVMVVKVHKSMTVNAALTDFQWEQSTSSSDRTLMVSLNNAMVGAASADEATSISRTVVAKKGDEISFRIMSASGTASYRRYVDGNWSITPV